MANQTQRPDTALHNTSHLMQYHDLIESIVAAMDARDAYTAKHSDRVADMVLVLATALDLSEDETTLLHMAAHLHDIGKNLTGMMVEGSGWEVIDLGTDVPAEKYIQALDEHPGAVCGMSALLTTTMSNMQPMIATIRAKYPETKVVVGGAPLNAEFAQKIGADAYARDPQDNINWLESIVA